LISSNEVAIACGICHAVVVITTEAIAIATEIAVSTFLFTCFLHLSFLSS
jgi:hypothetical protein